MHSLFLTIVFPSDSLGCIVNHLVSTLSLPIGIFGTSIMIFRSKMTKSYGSLTRFCSIINPLLRWLTISQQRKKERVGSSTLPFFDSRIGALARFLGFSLAMSIFFVNYLIQQDRVIIPWISFRSTMKGEVVRVHFENSRRQECKCNVLKLWGWS